MREAVNDLAAECQLHASAGNIVSLPAIAQKPNGVYTPCPVVGQDVMEKVASRTRATAEAAQTAMEKENGFEILPGETFGVAVGSQMLPTDVLVVRFVSRTDEKVKWDQFGSNRPVRDSVPQT